MSKKFYFQSHSSHQSVINVAITCHIIQLQYFWEDKCLCPFNNNSKYNWKSFIIGYLFLKNVY